jgi:RNA polymerase sigma-70 factor (ECF subfamily)
VFLLKEIFEYEHTEIAEMLGISATNSRQLLHRAKTRLRDIRSASREAPDARRAVAERFADAFRFGDAAALTDLLAADVQFVSDGGGKVIAVGRPLAGRDDIVRFLLGLSRAAQLKGLADQVRGSIQEVNAEPALVLHVAGKLDGAWVFTIADDRITAIRVVRNPDKLGFLERQLSTPM